MEEIPKPDPLPPLRVGLTYNVKKNGLSDVADNEAEYDSFETVAAIASALEQLGCRVTLLEADAQLPARLAAERPDIVFNIAEGAGGRGREAQVPALLNLLGIPFTGSDETTLCIALDKALAKRVLSTYGIRTPRYRVIRSDDPDMTGRFVFPAIVKPNAEGSSKGIADCAVVADRRELRELVARNIRLYRQDMLVEEYIAGREFTVAVLGNGPDTRVFEPMEVVWLKPCKHNVYSYPVKQNWKELVRYECPAALSEGERTDIMATARRIYDALHCRDFSRVDFRLSADGKLYFIEINPLPGLAPGYSDFPMIAQRCGMDYPSLIGAVLSAALRRAGLPGRL
jgi:D-alanine-D-alanine ligase